MLNGQDTIDDVLVKTDSLHVGIIHSDTLHSETEVTAKRYYINVGSSLTKIYPNNESILSTSIRIGGPISKNTSYSLSTSYLNRNALINDQSFQGSFSFSGEKKGLNVSLSFSRNRLAPKFNFRIGGHHYIKPSIVLSGEYSSIKIDQNTNSSILTIRPSIIFGQFSSSLTLANDITNWKSFHPNIGLGLTFESTSSNVYALYLNHGKLIQPDLRTQLIQPQGEQFGFGGWTRNKISETISLTAALGYNSLHFDKTTNVSIINTNLSLTLNF